MATFITLALIVVFVAGIAAGKLHAEIKCLRERVAKLEDAEAKHLPYRTADNIENAEAAIIKAIREVRFDNELLDNALAHLQQARNGNKK